MRKMKTLTVNGKTYTVDDPDAAHIDDTAVGAAAWSSRNIVDKLCPGLSESGAVVSCEPVEGYPLSVVSAIEAVQEGSGDPRPAGWKSIYDLSWQIDQTSIMTDMLAAGNTYRVSFVSYEGYQAIDVTVLLNETGGVVPGVLSGSYYEFTMPTSDIAQIFVNWESVPSDATFDFSEYDPGNVRPITGFDSVQLWRGGKNLFNISKVLGGMNNGDGTLTVLRRGAAGSVPNTLRNYAPKLRVGETYTLSAQYTHTGNYIYLPGYNKSWAFGKAMTVTEEMLGSAVLWYNSIDTTGEDATPNIISDIQIELGTVATPYEPYRGDTFTIDFGQTVGKGTYDWNTGVLTVTHALIRLTSDMKWVMTGASNPNGIRSFYVNENTENARDSHNYPVKSSHYINEYNWAVGSVTYENAIKILNSRIYLTDARFTDLASFKAFLEEETVQLMYALAEPVTVQLDPQEILALSGENTLTSDTGDTTVSGKADPAAVIEKLTSAIVALGGNV